MRIALAYVHMHQSYVGGLLRRAARRLGLDVVTFGPRGGQWIHDAPIEEGWEPDVEVKDPGEDIEAVATGGFDALVNVDQGDGFYLDSNTNIPIAHVFTEGNENEYLRAEGCAASAVWSCMPHKEEGKRQPGLLHLNWGYDPEHTPLVNLRDEDPELVRTIDVTLRGSWSTHRQETLERLLEKGLKVDAGPPLSRQAWGDNLRRSLIAICDHDGPYLTGRIVDAMAAGALVLAAAHPCLDVLAPRGYAPVKRRTDGRPDPVDIAAQAARWVEDYAGREAIRRRAARVVVGLSWDDQLLWILGSVGVRIE